MPVGILIAELITEYQPTYQIALTNHMRNRFNIRNLTCPILISETDIYYPRKCYITKYHGPPFIHVVEKWLKPHKTMILYVEESTPPAWLIYWCVVVIMIFVICVCETLMIWIFSPLIHWTCIIFLHAHLHGVITSMSCHYTVIC